MKHELADFFYITYALYVSFPQMEYEYIFMLIDELNWHNSVSEKLLGDVSVGKRIAYVKTGTLPCSKD